MGVDDAVGDVVCIVVHHNSPDTLGATLESLSDNGVLREQILVVDNSTQTSTARDLAAGYAVLRTDNRGYAAAVNDGLAHLRRQGIARPFTLVSTHESLAAPDAVRALRDEMRADPRIAVAGPTLLDSDAEMRIWSVGGYLSRWLKLPRHITAVKDEESASGVDRDWLDGAFTLYRTDELESFQLDETYFLYFEETDLHTRFVRSGRRVVWVPRAVVSQRSSGIPPRLLGRNLFLFHDKLFSVGSARAAVAYEISRTFGKALLTKRSRWASVPAVAKGWREAERMRAAAARADAGHERARSWQ